MQIHDGFPTDTAIGPDGKGKGFLMRFDPKTLLMPDDYYDATFHSHTKLSTNPPTYRYTFDAAQPAGKVGDYVAVSHPPFLFQRRFIAAHEHRFIAAHE